MLRLPERIHKRPFVVAAGVTLTLLIITGVIFLVFGFFGSGSNLMKVYITSKSTGTDVGGVGMNLTYVPTPNLLKNPSFEDRQYDKVYTVSGGTGNAVYVQSDSDADAVFGDGVFTGGTVRIMSLDQDGEMINKMQAGVTDFRINQLGLWTPYTIPSGASEGQKITSLSSSSGMTVAVGEKGLLISDVTSSTPAILDVGISADFAAGSCVSDRFNAVTKTGTFAISADGKIWNTFSPDPGLNYSMNTVTSIGKIGIAAGSAGTILALIDGKIQKMPSMTEQELMTSVGDKAAVIIAGNAGTVLTTSNGILFRTLSEQEMPVFADTPDWQCSDFRNGMYVLGGDKGQIALGSYTEETGLFSFVPHQAADEQGNRIFTQKILLLPSGEIIIMDHSNILYCSTDGGDTWKKLSVSSMKEIDEIGQTASGKLLFSQGITTQTTQLYTRIQFDETLSEDIFQAGDMCFLQRLSPSQVDQTTPDASKKTAQAPAVSDQTLNAAGIWQCMGNATTAHMRKQAPTGGGISSLRLTGTAVQTGDQAHYISEVLSAGSDMKFQKNTLYQIKVWLKQDGIANREVMAWVSGKFTSTGTTFTEVGSSWRQFTYTFLLPAEAAGLDQGEIRFNIGFKGTGTLDIDKVYFGLQSNADSSMPKTFFGPVISSSPVLIRLDNIGLGRMGVPTAAWSLSSGNEGLIKAETDFTAAGCDSLDASLVMVREAGSNPWLVIGSAASPTTIDNLMSYLCGSIPDTFGKIRVENGTAMPWTMQFAKLVFEISDPDNIFATDLQRGAYVDFIINSIKSSPYYNDVKSKFMFVDGMVYEGGTMLSNADYHASSLSVSNLNRISSDGTVLPFEDALLASYTSYFDSIPRTPSKPQQSASEWIRSGSLSIFQSVPGAGKIHYSPDSVTAADCVRLLLSDLGDHTSIVLSDLPVSRNSADIDTDLLFANLGVTKSEKTISAQNSRTMLSACTILSDSVKGIKTQIDLVYPQVITDANSSAQDTVSAAVKDALYTFACKSDNKIHTIIANVSDQPVIFLLEGDQSLSGVYVYRYSSEGKFLQKVKLGKRNNKINLLPGQVVKMEITLS